MSVFLFERAQNLLRFSETFSSWTKSTNGAAVTASVSEGAGEFGSDVVTFTQSGSTANDFSILLLAHSSLDSGSLYRNDLIIKVPSGGVIGYRGVLNGANYSVYTGDGRWTKLSVVNSASNPTANFSFGLRGTLATPPQTLTVEVLRAQTRQGSESGPYQATSDTAVTSAYPFVSLDEIDWQRKDERIESTHEMRSGRQYRYKWGEKEKVTFRASEVSSADACQINSWWGAGVALVAQHQTRFETTSGYLVNKTQPFDQFIESDARYFRGKIELESF